MKLPFSNKRARGVAILIVMVSLALMMAVVTELSTKEIIRYKLAINERDALQAEALAASGANFAQLILMVQEPLQMYMSNFAKAGIQLPAYTVWELMPINSELLKGITKGSVLPDLDFLSGKTGTDQADKTAHADKADKAHKTDKKDAADKEKETVLFGPYEVPEGGYGGFNGFFSTEITDEESKISIRKWPKHQPPQRKMIADQIFRVLSKKEYEPLFEINPKTKQRITPSQLIGNIYDYISEEDRSVDVSAAAENFGRDLIGDKRTAYVDNPGISPKKAPMDSLAELRLVPGVDDRIYQLLSKIITPYGESETVNILSASDNVLGSVFYLCAKNKESSPFQRLGFEAELLAHWHNKKDEGNLEISSEGVIKFLEENGIEVDKDACGKVISTESKTFTVKSTATVGTVTKTLIMRLRSAGGITTLYQFEYL